MTDLFDHPAGEQLGALIPQDAGEAPEFVAHRSTFGHKKGVSAMRIIKTKELVEELKVRGMSRADMSEFLEFSPSGARKYLADLRAAHLVEISEYPDEVTGQDVYVLVQDEAKVEAFVDSLSTEGKPLGRAGRPPAIEIAMRDKTRHFHLAADDAHFAVRIRRQPVAADPLALPSEFFARRELAPIPAPVRAPVVATPQPTGFAALAVRFEREQRA